MNQSFVRMAICILIFLVFSRQTSAADKSDAKETTLANLNALLNGPAGEYCTVWKGTFYCGTADGFHFLRNKYQWPRPDMFLKIKVEELSITPQMDYSADRSKWVEISRIIEMATIR